MVTIKTRSGSAYKTLRTLFDNDFEPEKGYPIRIPLMGNHISINHSNFYWKGHNFLEKEEEEEEAILDVASNVLFLEIDGQRRVIIDIKNIKKLYIQVRGGLFQKDNYTESYYLYFGAEEKDFY
jgi:hypothetical protein